MFHIHKSKDGQYYFVIKAKNGKVLMTSETYTRKISAENGIAAVKINIAQYSGAGVVDNTVSEEEKRNEVAKRILSVIEEKKKRHY